MKNYDIHNILKVRTNVEFLPKSLETSKISSPDLEIVEKDFDFKKEGLSSYYRFPIKFYDGKKKLFVEFTPKKLLLRIALENLEGKTKFYFKESAIYRPFHNVIFPAWPSIINLIRFLLQVKFLQKGVAAIHSATLSKDGVGIIMPAWPGTGKSTTCRNLMDIGFKVLGDEISLLSKSGKLYRIFESSSFSPRSIKPTFGRKKRFYFDGKEKVEKLKKIVFLKKGNRRIERKKPRDIINTMLASTVFEFQNSFTRQVFLSYCFSNNFDPDFVEKNTRKILDKSLKKADCYVVYGDRSNFHKTIERLLSD